MTVRALMLMLCVTASVMPGVSAQTPSPAPAPRTPAPAPRAEQANTAVAPRREFSGQAVNIKVDVTITDQRGSTTSPKKTITVVTGDQLSGYIRTQTLFPSVGDVPLNVDAEPHILNDGKIRLRLNLQYDLPAPVGAPVEPETRASLKTTIRENLAVILENGKPLIIAQSADPVTDRQVTVEVKATILR